MNEKKRNILDSAMRLFAQKGFHLTSMQEIAEQADVAKGSLYTYFHSKEDLLLSILEYYDELVKEKLSAVDQEGALTAKQKFSKQISLQLAIFDSHRDFIMMHLREQVFHSNEEINRFLFQMRRDTIKWTQHKILDIYGEATRPYSIDCALIFNGMLKEYLFSAIVDGWTLPFEQMSKYLLKRLDDIVTGCLASGDAIITGETARKILSCPSEDGREILLDKIKQQILAENSSLPEKTKEQAISALSALQEGLPDERNAVIQESLLLFLEQMDIKGTKQFIRELRTILPKETSF